MTASTQREKKISFNDVLAQTDTSFNNLFNMALLPQLEDRRVVPRGLGKSLQKRSAAQRIPFLLGYMKKMKPERFIDFLEILEENSKSEEENEETRKNTQRLMVIMSARVKEMFTYGGQDAEDVIRSFLDTADGYSSLQSSTAPAAVKIEESLAAVRIVETLSSRPPLRPPPGFMSDPLARHFGREGGTLYSPIHGIEVVIPPGSVPQDVDGFSLSFHVYPQGPFVLPNDVISCSPAVWFTLSPYFEFVENVAVRIPHSGSIDDDLDISVYHTPPSSDGRKEPPYYLSEKVAVVECDWYDAIIHVKHFSPHKLGAEKRGGESVKKVLSQALKHSSKNPVVSSLKNLSKQRSSSFELDDDLTVKHQSSFHTCTAGTCAKPNPQDSPDTHTAKEQSQNTDTITQVQASCVAYRSANRFCITREMPRDRSKAPWDEKFHVVHSHPSHIWQKISFKIADKKECVLSSPKQFRFVTSSLQFSRQEVSDGWSVEPTDGEEITLDDLEFLSIVVAGSNLDDAIKTGAYPSTITYHVDSNHCTTQHSLKCVIDVTGADRELKYTLTSSALSYKGPASLNTLTDLYDVDSQLLQELTSGNSTTNVRLDPEITDHLSLITDLSIQLPDPEKLSKMLQIDEIQFQRIMDDHKGCAEQVFQLFHAWICAHRPTIAELCTVLGVNEITSTNDESSTSQIRARLKEQHVSLSDPFFLKLYPFLQASWRFVARFLGFSEDDITTVEKESPHKCEEQSFQMLRKWQMKHGDRATYDRIFTAVKRLWSYESTRGDINNAYCCFITHVHIHLKI